MVSGSGLKTALYFTIVHIYNIPRFFHPFCLSAYPRRLSKNLVPHVVIICYLMNYSRTRLSLACLLTWLIGTQTGNHQSAPAGDKDPHCCSLHLFTTTASHFKLCPVVSPCSAPPDSLEQHSVQELRGRSGQEEWSPHHRSLRTGI